MGDEIDAADPGLQRRRPLDDDHDVAHCDHCLAAAAERGAEHEAARRRAILGALVYVRDASAHTSGLPDTDLQAAVDDLLGNLDFLEEQR